MQRLLGKAQNAIHYQTLGVKRIQISVTYCKNTKKFKTLTLEQRSMGVGFNGADMQTLRMQLSTLHNDC